MNCCHPLRKVVATLLLSSVLLRAQTPTGKIAPVLQPFVDNHVLAGAVVLVADPAGILNIEPVGWADIAAKKPMRTDSVFWIASQSKPITAAALMILVDEGKVNVDDPVEKYLPEFQGQQLNASTEPGKPRLQAPQHPILVREILSHTSGLDFKSSIESPTLDLLPLSERVKSYAGMPLLFEPGTRYKYSNAGINTAGRIIEVVSGLSFERFIEERIFKPLEMRDTTFFPNKQQIERLAKSYKPGAQNAGIEETNIAQLKYPLDDPERRAMPAGGLFSTAHDLSMFYRMLANNGALNGSRILSEKAVKTMTSEHTGLANAHYGFGIGTDGKSFTHGGAYGTNSRYDLERKLITVFLVQHAGWAGNGKAILPEFQKAATEAYGSRVTEKTANAESAALVVGINSAPEAHENTVDDWGLHLIRPVGGPDMALEPVDGVITIGKTTRAAPQKWSIVRGAEGFFFISPSSDPSRVLSVENGGAQRGTRIVLETNSGKPSQLWAFQKQEGGAYTLTPKHAPHMALDDLGGKTTPGARIDLWDKKAGDRHLHWLVQPLAGSPASEPASNAAVIPAGTTDAAYRPPSIKPEDILPGETKHLVFAHSKVFPGTVREVTVFIPKQYDAKKPACVYVKTDGFNPREKLMMETMIATGEMPVTVGVFVRPGELPAPMKGTLGRRNRDFEYDGIGDENVRFLVDELLPFVAKECSLNLSNDGNDRCMSGGSSGGIAAFTAAWHRPAAFSRVYAASGSWVAFRGGHEFPTLVRKFEARPIRAFLTTATLDMENCAGDWFLADQEMDKALKFAGYDYRFRKVEGRHVAGYAENYQEAMAYLWKDWPQRVRAGHSAPRAQEIILPDEGWQLAAEGFKSTRGPSCNAQGEVYFADTSANKIHRINLDGSVSEFAKDTGNAHCVSVGPDGTVYTISEKSGKLMRYAPGGAASVVLDDILGHSILATPDGGLYVTANAEKQRDAGAVWFIKDGEKRQVDSGLGFATGMAYRPDRWLLSIADGHSKWAYSYQMKEDGSLMNKERFFHLHVHDWQDDAGTESVCYSIEGRQFLATKSGIQISADDGPTQVILPVPDNARVTGVAIGGRDLDTLFAFCGNRIWKRKIRQHAMGAWSPWTPVTGTKL